MQKMNALKQNGEMGTTFIKFFREIIPISLTCFICGISVSDLKADHVKIKNIEEKGFACIYVLGNPLHQVCFDRDDSEILISLNNYKGFSKKDVEVRILQGKAGFEYVSATSTDAEIDLSKINTKLPLKKDIDDYILKFKKAILDKDGNGFAYLYLSENKNGLNKDFPIKQLNSSYRDELKKMISKNDGIVEEINIIEGRTFVMIANRKGYISIRSGKRVIDIPPLYIGIDTGTGKVGPL